ncbi:hypothetical protein [Streptosporangium sp. NPDC051022]|uniref:hypothetical protein n=1 Tax=Streptosporangium sp. NPDC051022 TaxID=3155752 RepID=UPI003429457F
MRTGSDTIADIDWTRLFHAYGVASDTPAHLRALAGDGEEARAEAVDHLFGAVIHQGTPWSATPPAALVVAGLLADPRTAGAAPGHAVASGGSGLVPLRAVLLEFLGEVAEAAQPQVSEDEIRAVAHPEGREAEVAALLEALLDGDEDAWGDELVDAVMARVVLDLRWIAPILVDSVTACLDDDDLHVRSRAVGTLAALALIPDAVARPADLSGRLERAAREAVGHDERCALLLALGELGAAPRDFLADPHPAVRVCAALAPALDGDAAATREILAALEDPAAADSWLAVRPRQLFGHLRFALVAAAVRKTGSFEELLPAALGIAGMTNGWTVDFDWGPLLAAAFPEPVVLPEAAEPPALTGAQRRYLEALVTNDDVWDPRIGNAHRWFGAAGLTYDRDACRALLAGTG